MPAESVESKYRDNFENPVIINLPVMQDTRSLILGSGVGFGPESGEVRIAPRPTSVFSDAFLSDPTNKPTGQSDQQLKVKFIEDLDIYKLTKESSLAINIAAKGFWGSASASYNEKKFQEEYKEKLMSQASLEWEDATVQLFFNGESLGIFDEVVQEWVMEARAAFDDGQKGAARLKELRRNFQQTYGTCYVGLEYKGARLVINASQRLDTQRSMFEQKKAFKASTSGMGLIGSAKGSVTAKNKVETFIKNSDVEIRAFQQGGDGTLPLGDNREEIWKYINDGLRGVGWVETAKNDPPRVTLGILPYASIPALAILASPSPAVSQISGSRELDPIYPLMDGKEDKDYSAIGTFLQYPTGWGAVQYSLVPIPIPVGKIRVDKENGIVRIPVRMHRFDDLRSLIKLRWSEAKTKLDPRDKLFFDELVEPEPIPSATIWFDVDYDYEGAPGTPENARIVAFGGDGPRQNKGNFPPDLAQLYNDYPNTRDDVYSFSFKGSLEALEAFPTQVKAGIRLRPVVDINGVQQIRLTPFRVKTDDNLEIEVPKRIERPETSEALRRLQSLEDSTVSREMVRTVSQATQNARSPYTHLAAVPGFYKIRVVASGLFSLWNSNAALGPDYKGGAMRYLLTKDKLPPPSVVPTGIIQRDIKAAEVWEWENKSGDVVFVSDVIYDEGGRSDNRGEFKLDIEIVPRGVPFRALPDDLQKKLEARKTKPNT
jgi:hypothetical protein